MKLGVIGVGAVALALIGGLLLFTQVSAAAHRVDIHDGTAAPGEEVAVDLGAHDITAPGLGAWTIDISYDGDVVSVVTCAPAQGGVCNPEFGDDVIRVTGASAGGLQGDTVLATITFECGDDEGTSALTLDVNVLADATIGDPQDITGITTVSDGTITCEEPEPATETEEPVPTPTVGDLGQPGTGFGSSSDGSGLGWLVAVLAAVGLAGVVGFGALRLRARQS